MHRKRQGFRRSLALFTGTLLTAASLTLVAQPAGADEPETPEFQQVTLAKGAAETGEPMSLAVLPD
ncbi:hypothetical protein G3I76_13440, partial [Streptomyces sp. SID11233]|nr:hypothetical protein [Streptomyces sp. SID11233]